MVNKYRDGGMFRVDAPCHRKTATLAEYRLRYAVLKTKSCELNYLKNINNLTFETFTCFFGLFPTSLHRDGRAYFARC